MVGLLLDLSNVYTCIYLAILTGPIFQAIVAIALCYIQNFAKAREEKRVQEDDDLS